MKTLILTIVTLFVCSVASFAQEKKTEEVKRRAEQKAENRADRKIDRTIDNGLDAVENLFKFGKKKKKKKGEENTSESTSNANETNNNSMGMLSNMFGGGDIEVKDEYTFNHDILIEITSIKKSGKVDGVNEMRYFISDTEEYMGYEMANPDEQNKKNQQFAKGIMNWSEGIIITIMEEQKQIMAMKMNMENIEKEMDKGMDEQIEKGFSFEKTGKTKEILGYTCEEYYSKTDDYENYVWLTDETDLDMSRAMMGQAMMKKMKDKMPSNYPKGAFMESTITSLKNGEVTIMKTKEINKNTNPKISTKGYQVMNLGSFLDQDKE